MKKIYIYWIFFQSDDRNKKYENILTKKNKDDKKEIQHDCNKMWKIFIKYDLKKVK